MVLAGSQVNYYVWPTPPPTLFYVNPCSTQHSATVCVDASNKSLPYMMCQMTNDGVFDLGSQVAYTETARGEITMTMSGGTPCGEGATRVNRNTPIFLHVRR